MSPEQLDPSRDERRWSASAIYTAPIGPAGYWATSAIWAQRRATGPNGRGPALAAWVLESAVHPDDRWTVFGRAERIDNDELAGSNQPETVGRIEIGAVRDFRVAAHLKAGIGASALRSLVGAALAASYGGDRWGGMGFVRLKVG